MTDDFQFPRTMPTSDGRGGRPSPWVPRWLPNAVSVMRIALVPLWLVLAFFARDRAEATGGVQRLPLLLVLLGLGLSDVLDGQLARRFHLETNFGAMLDAVADKLAQVAMVTFLTWNAEPAFTPLPLWLWTGLLARDGLLGIGWLVLWSTHRAIRVEHRWHGRAASLLLFALTFAATAGMSSMLVVIGAGLALLLVIPSTAAYLREGFRQLRTRDRTHA